MTINLYNYHSPAEEALMTATKSREPGNNINSLTRKAFVALSVLSALTFVTLAGPSIAQQQSSPAEPTLSPNATAASYTKVAHMPVDEIASNALGAPVSDITGPVTTNGVTIQPATADTAVRSLTANLDGGDAGKGAAVVAVLSDPGISQARFVLSLPPHATLQQQDDGTVVVAT